MTDNPKIVLKAGVVAVRPAAKGSEVLLITSRLLPKKWVLPSGTVDVGETLAETAVRECREESGVNVTLGPELITVDLARPDKNSIHRVTYFLAQYVSEAESDEPDRERTWVLLAEAEQHLPLPQMQQAVRLANRTL